MNSFKKIKSLKGFKNLSFYSQDSNQILEALRLLHKLDYSTIDGCFNIEDAVTHNGLCAWSDGDISEGWLIGNAGLRQVTLKELKEMVGEGKEVLWLNIETLEERVINDGKKFYSDVWVKVPDGATFATGDKDNFVFRKDGWYYNNQKGWWVKGSITIKDVCKHKLATMFWVGEISKEENKPANKGEVFTLERLIGCEVLFDNESYYVIYVYYTHQIGHLVLENDSRRAYISDFNYLTFFTEYGGVLTFDEYVQLYYPKG